jgi:hypothetical protein
MLAVPAILAAGAIMLTQRTSAGEPNVQAHTAH